MTISDPEQMRRHAPKMRRPGAAFALQNPIHFLATGFLSGLAPRAPGTFGTLATFPLWWALVHLPGQWLLPILIAMTLFGIPICGRTARASGLADPGFVVWDEIAAFCWVLYACPPHWLAWLLAFGWFRLFDAAKLWPISWLDRHLHGGLGIMVDDLAAAAASILCLAVMHHLWPGGLV